MLILQRENPVYVLKYMLFLQRLPGKYTQLYSIKLCGPNNIRTVFRRGSTLRRHQFLVRPPIKENKDPVDKKH